MELAKKYSKIIFSKIAYLGSRTPLSNSKLAQKIYLTSENLLNKKLLNYETKTEYNGFKFIVNPSEFVGRAIYMNDGKYEEEIDALIDKEAEKGDIILDVGANIGVHTLKLAEISGDDGRVYAFEPDPINRQRLEENIKINNLENIEIIGKACSNKNDKTEIRRFEENWGASSLKDRSVRDNPDQIKEVKTIKLSSFIENRNIEPDFIKIDVEGLEKEVIEGLDEQLDKVDKIFIELHNDANDEKSLKTIFSILNGEGRIFSLKEDRIESYKQLRDFEDIIWKS